MNRNERIMTGVEFVMFGEKVFHLLIDHFNLEISESELKEVTSTIKNSILDLCHRPNALDIFLKQFRNKKNIGIKWATFGASIAAGLAIAEIYTLNSTIAFTVERPEGISEEEFQRLCLEFVEKKKNEQSGAK